LVFMRTAAAGNAFQKVPQKLELVMLRAAR
jgi:hypothetical protein